MNKVKILMALLLMTGMGASAALIDFQFNDANGTAMTRLSNSGTDAGAAFDRDLAGAQGTGSALTISGPNVVHDSCSTVALTSTLTSGQVVLEYSITGSWSVLAKKNGFSIKILNELGTEIINLRNIANHAADQLKVRDGDAASQEIKNAGTDFLVNKTIRITINLDTASYVVEYSLDGGAWEKLGKNFPHTKASLTGVSGFLIETAASTAWSPTDVAALDYITVTATPPEPATVGMLRLPGLALIMVLRIGRR